MSNDSIQVLTSKDGGTPLAGNRTIYPHEPHPARVGPEKPTSRKHLTSWAVAHWATNHAQCSLALESADNWCNQRDNEVDYNIAA